MKHVSTDEVKHVLKLSNISITQNEQNKYSKDLSEVINYNMEHLESVNTKKIEATGHAAGEKSVTRNDETEPGLSFEKALKNSKGTHNNFFIVRHVFGERNE